MKFQHLFLFVLIILTAALSFQLLAAEYNTRGIIDIRISENDSLTSYRDGGYGKFDLSNGGALSLAQAGLSFSVDWDSGLSAHLVLNGYHQNDDARVGVTEGYLKYLSLPSENGYRWQSRFGFYYPEISIENNAFAWASKYTLNSSTINTWLGEEVRVLGNEYTLTRLGKFHQHSFDIEATLGLFVNNDPTGALLSWHGWTIGNRQTLYHEQVTLPPLLALQPGNPLEGKQAIASDPFKEVDDRLGWYGSVNINWHKQGKLLVGYYDNNAKPYVIENGQYAWRTRFAHLGFEYRLVNNYLLYGQYLLGDTLMQNPLRIDVVNNDYQSAYVALSKKFTQHRVTIRAEEFSVTDLDNFAYDNNNEYGKALTFNYTYRLKQPLFLSVEHNWLNSHRPARAYVNAPIKLKEQQTQVALRYFFH